MNQTTMMYEISRFLDEFDCAFTPYYCNPFYRPLQRMGLLDFTILGGPHQRNTRKIFAERNLRVDEEGREGRYDLVVTCSDLMIQDNIRDKPMILVQEGMTDPQGIMFHVVRALRPLLPLWMATTSTTGLSDAYVKFCVASEGYRNHFIRNGARPEKIEVTGIPNFDNVAQYLNNDFGLKDYALAATSDLRESYRYDNRRRFIERALSIANGRQLLFKLHPNENIRRATGEIEQYAPGALVFASGNTNHMVANCHTLITQFSTVVYLGLALGKRVFSYLDIEKLRRLTPLQNGGQSAKNIAEVCRNYLA
jgi:hypothetical protein